MTTQYINYTHILYNETIKGIDIKDGKKLFDLVLKYHYPCCMNSHTQIVLTEEEKKE